MNARKVLGIPADRELGTYGAEEISATLIGLYRELAAEIPDKKDKIAQLISRAQAACDALIWEGWERTVQFEEPWNDYTGKPPHEKLVRMLEEYAQAPDLDWLEKEPDRDFRNRLFHGKDRIRLMLDQPQRIELGDIPEQDLDGRIRQGYLAELGGDIEAARRIYGSAGFSGRPDISEENSRCSR